MGLTGYRIYRNGDNVAGLLDRIENLDGATYTTDGLMTKTDKRKLDEMVEDAPLSILEIDEICNF